MMEGKKVKKALLVIDMQNVCVGKNHATYFKYDNEILIQTVNEVIDANESNVVVYIKNIMKKNLINKLASFKAYEGTEEVELVSNLHVISDYVFIKYEGNAFSKLIFNKQNIILILIAILFSPMVIGVRFICCKIDKIENRKIKAVIKVIGFVVFSSYLVSLKENVAYLLIGIFSLVYLLYQFYLSGLETK